MIASLSNSEILRNELTIGEAIRFSLYGEVSYEIASDAVHGIKHSAPAAPWCHLD